MHNDIDMPFPKKDQEPYMLRLMKDLFVRYYDATVIWAHLGVGRVVRPLEQQMEIVQKICQDSQLKHVYMDISWDEVAKYVTAPPEAIQRTADMINRFPDRFLFGTDVVAPGSQQKLLAVYHAYDPVWKLLTPDARHKILFGNNERLFDDARIKVRRWERRILGEVLKC